MWSTDWESGAVSNRRIDKIRDLAAATEYQRRPKANSSGWIGRRELNAGQGNKSHCLLNLEELTAGATK
jgi:hypothetical protein